MFEDKVKKQNKGSLSKYLALWCKPTRTLFSRKDSSVGFPGSALQQFWFIASGCLPPPHALPFPSRLRYFPASGTQQKTFTLELTSQRSHRSLQREGRDKKISGQQKTKGQLTFTSGSTNIIQAWPVIVVVSGPRSQKIQYIIYSKDAFGYCCFCYF